MESLMLQQEKLFEALQTPCHLILQSQSLEQGNLYLGNQSAAGYVEKFEPNVEQIKQATKEKLKGFKITHILCCADNREDFPGDFIYHQAHVGDSPDPTNLDIISQIKESIVFIDKALEVGNILVHCNAGCSRSPTHVVCYLMKYKKMSLEDAEQFVKERRCCVDISNFRDQVKNNWEQIV